jgi:hypothetical protein
MVLEGKAFIGTDAVYNFSANHCFEYRQPRKRILDGFRQMFCEVQHCHYWSKKRSPRARPWAVTDSQSPPTGTLLARLMPMFTSFTGMFRPSMIRRREPALQQCPAAAAAAARPAGGAGRRRGAPATESEAGRRQRAAGGGGGGRRAPQ